MDRLQGSSRDRATGPRRRTQVERSETTRRKLFEAAIEVLNAQGYSGFTLTETARRAGVTRGAQAHHFKSKDDFILNAVEHLYKQIIDRSRESAARARGVNVTDPIFEDARAFFLSDEFITLFELMVALKKTKSDGAIEILSERYRGATEELWIDYLADKGTSREEAGKIVWLIFSIVRGLAIRRAFSYRDKVWNDTYEFGHGLVLDHFARLSSPAAAGRNRAE